MSPSELDSLYPAAYAPPVGKRSLRLLDFIRLLVSTKLFIDAEERHHPKMAEKYEAWGDFDREDHEARIRKKRIGLWLSLAQVAGVVAAGYGSAIAANSLCPIPQGFVVLVRVSALMVIAWSVLGRLGYETETVKGETLLELTSLAGFKLGYWLGIYLATLALFLDPSGSSFEPAIQAVSG